MVSTAMPNRRSDRVNQFLQEDTEYDLAGGVKQIFDIGYNITLRSFTALRIAGNADTVIANLIALSLSMNKNILASTPGVYPL